MRRHVFLAAVASVFTATVLMAAEVDGKWKADVQQQQLTFDFKVAGSSLTGTLENSAVPGAVQIKEGKVNGDKVSFHVARTLNNAETRVLWEGTVSDEQIKFTRRAENAAAGEEPTAIVATRNK